MIVSKQNASPVYAYYKKILFAFCFLWGMFGCAHRCINIVSDDAYGEMFYFTSAATIMQRLDVLIKATITLK
jgi:hypothetical protein